MAEALIVDLGGPLESWDANSLLFVTWLVVVFILSLAKELLNSLSHLLTLFKLLSLTSSLQEIMAIWKDGSVFRNSAVFPGEPDLDPSIHTVAHNYL